jgi:hypothetical protein
VSCLLVAWLLLLLQLGGTVEQQLERKMAFVRELKCLPVAVQTATANEQHYEVQLPPPDNIAANHPIGFKWQHRTGAFSCWICPSHRYSAC